MALAFPIVLRTPCPNSAIGSIFAYTVRILTQLYNLLRDMLKQLLTGTILASSLALSGRGSGLAFAWPDFSGPIGPRPYLNLAQAPISTISIGAAGWVPALGPGRR